MASGVSQWTLCQGTMLFLNKLLFNDTLALFQGSLIIQSIMVKCLFQETNT
jgi:hypothetical protein